MKKSMRRVTNAPMHIVLKFKSSMTISTRKLVRQSLSSPRAMNNKIITIHNGMMVIILTRKGEAMLINSMDTMKTEAGKRTMVISKSIPPRSLKLLHRDDTDG